jgi:hypothetical protein
LLLDDRSSAVVDVVGFLAVETPGGPAGRSGPAETLALVEVFEKVGNGVETGVKVYGPVWKLAVIVGFFETLALVEVVDKVGNGPVGVLTLGRLAVIVGFAVSTLQPVDTPS